MATTTTSFADDVCGLIKSKMTNPTDLGKKGRVLVVPETIQPDDVDDPQVIRVTFRLIPPASRDDSAAGEGTDDSGRIDLGPYSIGPTIDPFNLYRRKEPPITSLSTESSPRPVYLYLFQKIPNQKKIEVVFDDFLRERYRTEEDLQVAAAQRMASHREFIEKARRAAGGTSSVGSGNLDRSQPVLLPISRAVEDARESFEKKHREYLSGKVAFSLASGFVLTCIVWALIKFGTPVLCAFSVFVSHILFNFLLSKFTAFGSVYRYLSKTLGRAGQSDYLEGYQVTLQIARAKPSVSSEIVPTRAFQNMG